MMTADWDQGGLESLSQRADPLGAMADLLAAARDALATSEAEGVAGGGAVRITMNGERRITALHISPDAMAAGDSSLLEELILAAAADAYSRAEAIKEDAMERLGKLLSDPPGAS